MLQLFTSCNNSKNNYTTLEINDLANSQIFMKSSSAAQNSDLRFHPIYDTENNMVAFQIPLPRNWKYNSDKNLGIGKIINF